MPHAAESKDVWAHADCDRSESSSKPHADLVLSSRARLCRSTTSLLRPSIHLQRFLWPNSTIGRARCSSWSWRHKHRPFQANLSGLKEAVECTELRIRNIDIEREELRKTVSWPPSRIDAIS